MKPNLMEELKYLREENKPLAKELMDAKAAAKENWQAMVEAELEISLLKAKLYDLTIVGEKESNRREAAHT